MLKPNQLQRSHEAAQGRVEISARMCRAEQDTGHRPFLGKFRSLGVLGLVMLESLQLAQKGLCLVLWVVLCCRLTDGSNTEPLPASRKD
jgi:hypothetical protein